MFRQRSLVFLTFFIFLFSCGNEEGYTYAIKDFRKSLQPYLFKIVSKGVVMYYDSSLSNMATDKELSELAKSEHPVLRGSAFREILHRKSFNHFDMMMNHLDDTAVVATDAGEFGTWYRMVSDVILKQSTWESQQEKNKTIEQVLTKHNYLQSAYHILLEIVPEEKYYSFIKDMATRPRHLTEDGYELEFNDVEYALYGLAKFKKPEDVKLIKNKMRQNIPWLSFISFSLMTEFPDTAYLDILQSYHRRRFYKFSGNRRDGFSGVVSDRADPEDFIRALAVQQNTQSAQLLDTMLNRLTVLTCMPDKENITDSVVMAIWEYPCPAYLRLREKIKQKAQKILKGQLDFPMDSLDEVQFDTTKAKILW